MSGLMSLLYGAFAYVLFLGAFLYAIAFVGNLHSLKTIDNGAAGPLVPALIIDTLLLGLFAVQHSAARLQALVDQIRAGVRRAVDLCAAREPCAGAALLAVASDS